MFNRTDIAEAWYIYLTEFHSGQWSREYKRLCRLLLWFTPAPGLGGREDLTENGRAIYDALTEGR